MGALSAADAALVELSAALAAGRPKGLERALRQAADHVPPAQVEEAILQSYLLLGFPAALEGMRGWREERKRPPEPEADSVAQGSGWRERGEELCKRIYGAAYERLRRNVRRLHPALDRWMVEEGYGKVLGRPGLDPARRELCNVAILAVSRHGRQLHSHLRGALNLGADPDAVEEALERGLQWASDSAWTDTARRGWDEVRCRPTESAG